MKNIILSIIGITMFTIIGCEQSPLSPVVETQFVVTDNVNNNTDFITTDKTIPVDSVLSCIDLDSQIVWDKPQNISIDVIKSEYKGYFGYLKSRYNRDVKKITDSYKNIIDSLNIDINNPNNIVKIRELNRNYKTDIQFRTDKYYSSVKSITGDFFKEIRRNLTTEQQIIWDEWVSTGKLPCEVKPTITNRNSSDR
jgi:hypothetical protein